MVAEQALRQSEERLTEQLELTRRLNADLERANRQLAEIARTDGLTGMSGWLVHNKAITIANFSDRFAEIERTHTPVKKYERGDWVIWYMKPLARQPVSAHLSAR